MGKTIRPTNPYTMKIERTIIDKLGLKLYDKVSAVVAETIANSYDADAENVTVRVPLGKVLAIKKGETIEQKGYVIEIHDDGHGMTPIEINEFYLKIGKDRREDPRQGDRSREKKRLVTGRKGIGKLASFGVCKTIEVRSAGGKKTPHGYKVTHFELDYDGIIKQTSEEDEYYHPTPLKDDDGWDKKRGTTIRLKNFLPRLVPNKEIFHRQLSCRFLPLSDFRIKVQDIKKQRPEKEFFIGEYKIPLMDGTKIIVDDRPVETDTGEKLPIKGWVAMAKNPYKNVEFAGVRIYARGKIAAITRDFGISSGFAGEYVARSYLVGEIEADWLDEKEDLLQTHRQDILWSTEVGQAFSAWGQAIVKEVAKKGREPRREKVRVAFLRISKLHEVARKRFNDSELEKAAIELGEKIGGFASEEELIDEEYVKGLREIILTVAPHKLLVDTFREIEKMAVGGKIEVSKLIKLFSTSHIAQLASYGQIVSEKIKAIDVFEKTIHGKATTEKELQKILEDAPWLIDPKWQVIMANRQLKNFRTAFQAWYKNKYNVEIATAADISFRSKRPDFILLHQQSGVKIAEIKSPKHVFVDEDMKRLNNYNDAMEKFWQENLHYEKEFPDKFQIILIVNKIKFRNSVYQKALTNLQQNGKLIIKNWDGLLNDTKTFHENFLQARDKF